MKLHFHFLKLSVIALIGGGVLIGCGAEEPPSEMPVPLPFDFGQEDQEPGEQNRPDDQGGTTPPPPTSGTKVIDGEPCTQDAQCQSNICLPDPEWPGGYCTTIECDTAADCADTGANNACLINPQSTNFCIRLCDPNSPNACRQGYQCQPVGGAGSGWCAPDAGNLSDFEGDGEFPFQVACASSVNGIADLRFDVSPSATSYMIVPLTSNGGWLAPLNVTTPSGNVINFRGENSFQSAGAQLFGSVNPTLVPAAPQFANQLESGQHTYRLQTQDSEVCYYLVENSPTNQTLDLNIYLLGMNAINLSPANAANHSDMKAVLAEVDSIFAQAGISLGKIRYPSVPANVENQYRVIRGQNDILSLARTSVYHGDDVDSALSANIFIVSQFAFAGGEGVLGMSLGIPGAAGLHASPLSGVALTGEYMGHILQGQGGRINGNGFTANTLAHELGHFLGLFHTSETSGQHHDPLADTPQCTNFRNPYNCPGASNLMFPLAGPGQDELTPNQAFVIGANPLTK